MPIITENNIPLDSRINHFRCLKPIPDVDLKINPDLPQNWIALLAIQVSVPEDSLAKHIVAGSTALSDGLKLIYQLLNEKNPSGQPVFNDSEKTLITQKIQEGISHCTPGFHNRVYSIIQDLTIPKNLDGLLYQIRKSLVQSVAAQLSSDIHHQNGVFTAAHELGYGVRPLNTKDNYQIATKSVSQLINNKFLATYQVIPILRELDEQINTTLRTEYDYQERKHIRDKGCGLLKIENSQPPSFEQIKTKLQGRDAVIFCQDKLGYANYKEKQLSLVLQRGCDELTHSKLLSIFSDLPLNTYRMAKDEEETDLLQSATNRFPEYAYSPGDVEALNPFFQSLFQEDSHAYFNLDEETMTRCVGLNWLVIKQKLLGMLVEQAYFNLSEQEKTCLYFLCDPLEAEEAPNLKMLFGREQLISNKQDFFNLLTFLEHANETKRLALINTSIQCLGSDKEKLSALFDIYQKLSSKQAALVKHVILSHTHFLTQKAASAQLDNYHQLLKKALKQKDKKNLDYCFFLAQTLKDTPEGALPLSQREQFFLTSPDLRKCLSAPSGYSDAYLNSILTGIQIAFSPEKSVKLLIQLGALQSKNSFLIQAWIEQFGQLPKPEQLALLSDPNQNPGILTLTLTHGSFEQISPLLAIITSFNEVDKQASQQPLRDYIQSHLSEPNAYLRKALEQENMPFVTSFLAYLHELHDTALTKQILLPYASMFFSLAIKKEDHAQTRHKLKPLFDLITTLSPTDKTEVLQKMFASRSQTTLIQAMASAASPSDIEFFLLEAITLPIANQTIVFQSSNEYSDGIHFLLVVKKYFRFETRELLFKLIEKIPLELLQQIITERKETGNVLIRRAIYENQAHLIQKLYLAGVPVNPPHPVEHPIVDIAFPEAIPSPLILEAVVQGKTVAVQSLLDCEADIETQRGDGDSLLYCAIETGNPPLVELLLNRGAKINQRMLSIVNAVELPRSKDQTDVLTLLFKKITLLPLDEQRALLASIPGDYQHVIHYASQQPTRDLLFHLVKNTPLPQLKTLLLDASKEHTGRNASRLLRMAVKANQADMVDLLIQVKGSINAVNSTGYTPLLLAVEGKHLATTNKLIEQGASLCIRTQENRNVFDICHSFLHQETPPLLQTLVLKAVELPLAEQAELFSQIKPMTYPSVFHYALYHLKDKVLLCQLMEKASPEMLRAIINEDNTYYDPLKTTFFQNVVSIPGQSELVQKLMPFANLSAANRNGATILDFVMLANDPATLDVLLTSPDVLIDSQLIDKAFRNDSPAVFERLLLKAISYPLEKQQRLFYQDSHRGPIFLISTLYKNKIINQTLLIKLLTKASEDKEVLQNLCQEFRAINVELNGLDPDNLTLLHRIIKANQVTLIPQFIEAGERLDTKNKQQNTALILAAMIGHLPTVQALLDTPSGLETLDTLGQDNCSALYWAIRHNHPPVVEYLLSKGARMDSQVHFPDLKKAWCPQDSTALGIALAHPDVLEPLLLKMVQEPFETQQALLKTAFQERFQHLLHFAMSGIANHKLLFQLIVASQPAALKAMIEKDPNIARSLFVKVLKEADKPELPALVQKLIEAGLFLGQDNQNQTVLMFSTAYGSLETFQLLLASSQEHLNQQDSHGYTALMHAVTQNQTPFVMGLLEKNADLTARSTIGKQNVIDVALKLSSESDLLQPLLKQANQTLSQAQQQELLQHVTGGIYPDVQTYVAIEHPQWLPALLGIEPNAPAFTLLQRAQFDPMLTIFVKDLLHLKKEAPYQTEAHMAATQLIIGLAREKIAFLTSAEPLTQARQTVFANACVEQITQATPDLEKIPAWKENLKTGLMVCSFLLLPLIILGGLAYAGFFKKAPETTKTALSTLGRKLREEEQLVPEDLPLVLGV